MKQPHVWNSTDYRIVAAIMGLMGAFFWAIRGTGGYGGEMGGMLAGFGWAVLWYGFSQVGEGADRRPYGHPWLFMAITLGIAYGGFTGYGVYIAWVQGKFQSNPNEMLHEVSAWTGYAMLFICGLHWGGNTGCFMAWCAPSKPIHARDWTLRLASGFIGAVAAALFVRAFPQLFLPFYSEGIYANPGYKTCIRALDSLHTIAPHVGVFLGFLSFEVLRGDRRAVYMILTMALGFAIPFAVGGYWHTLNGSELKLGWWKNWEMSIGLGGGLAFGIAFWLFNQPAQTARLRLSPKSLAFFRSGLPFGVPVLVVVLGAIDGRCGLHDIEVPSNYIWGFLALGTAGMAALWFWRARHEDSSPITHEYRVSTNALAIYIAVIVVAGWVVTIPKEWKLANVVLVGLYIVYLGVSAVLLRVFQKRIT
ncbi:MAG: hypothetical protein K1Y02_10210 [Candidatus Hydrogenedentes bacterium]|nr:hypothetical protein [Candidatus Hydrogenedentota bacterium]